MLYVVYVTEIDSKFFKSLLSVLCVSNIPTLLKIPCRKNGDSLPTMGAKLSQFILGSPFFGSHRNYIQAFTVIFKQWLRMIN